ncbi:class A beta-lactamase, subclass A2 [Shewanella sp. WXL01]|uniref:class A beta-lactamase, subclass A2 n=1 Tax=Shewanella sp. WXL01 TaxID=2709721 RepID=UPI0014385E6A|nr:class A beta-lactamase, subclass A2 [Shewanella sp. WXL01]NKF50391.1 class A beta-lactamase, subclass A2 [Shewanella sp. WXL01]
MLRQSLSITLLWLLSFSAYSQSLVSLNTDIKSLLDSKQATVGVSIWDQNANPIVEINADNQLPMQSVFKFHLAVAVLHQVDQGKWSLADKITITPDDLDNGLWSPIRKKYPTGAELTLAQIIKYTVAVSDNVGCDVLIGMLGGPKVLEQYLHQAGIKDVAIKYNEEMMQQVWQRQFDNWTTANGANQALSKLYDNNEQLLSATSHRFLWDVMKSSKTGKNKIRAGVPEGTVVAHKTGYSGKHNQTGVIAAHNDIGIVFLPNGSHYYISVLVSDSRESSDDSQKIIADISQLAWMHFIAEN